MQSLLGRLYLSFLDRVHYGSFPSQPHQHYIRQRNWLLLARITAYWTVCPPAQSANFSEVTVYGISVKQGTC